MSTQALLAQYDVGKDPAALQSKYQKMRQDAFAFFRGSVHLFYDNLPKGAAIGAPLAWVCGDAHAENFGSYMARNGLVYFDCNDFDHACLAPCSLDILRLASSLIIACHAHKQDGDAITQHAISAYRQALLEGKSNWVERAACHGLVEELLKTTKKRTHKDWLHERALKSPNGQLCINTDHKGISPASQAQIDKINILWALHAPQDWQLQDIACRQAGLASRGLERYLVLAKHQDEPLFLDIKAAAPSHLATLYATRQPAWAHPAERIEWAQHYLQAMPSAHLAAWHHPKQGSFVVRTLHPSEDRIALDALKSKDYADTARLFGQILAWNQIRAAGRKGAASVEALQAFAETDWEARLIQIAQQCADNHTQYWQNFQK